MWSSRSRSTSSPRACMLCCAGRNRRQVRRRRCRQGRCGSTSIVASPRSDDDQTRVVEARVRPAGGVRGESGDRSVTHSVARTGVGLRLRRRHKRGRRVRRLRAPQARCGRRPSADRNGAWHRVRVEGSPRCAWRRGPGWHRSWLPRSHCSPSARCSGGTSPPFCRSASTASCRSAPRLRRYLAAVAERLAQSELRTTLEGARVVTGGQTISLGLLPDDPLPETIAPGWSTARASGDRWRLYTVEVVRRSEAWRQDACSACCTARRCGREGEATAPAGHLRDGADIARSRVWSVTCSARSRLDRSLRCGATPGESKTPIRGTWRVGETYGSAEVDDVATTLNENLQRLADETHRRGAALDAARAFAASATHELRTPLQGALINLDMARSGRIGEPDRPRCWAWPTNSCNGWRLRCRRCGRSPTPSSPIGRGSTEVDLADVADAAVADERRRAPERDGRDRVDTADDASSPGATECRLAIANIVRNAFDTRRAGRWFSPASRRVGRRHDGDRRRQRPRSAASRPPACARAIRARRRQWFGPRPGDRPAGRDRPRRLGDDRVEPARRCRVVLSLHSAGRCLTESGVRRPRSTRGRGG